jgi:mitochondrial intermembrane space import and assembly protein 40
MQDCFRLHPDIYGSELQEDEVDEQLTEQIAQRDREEQARKEQQTSSGGQQAENKITLEDPAVSSLNDAEKQAETAEIRNATESQPSQQEEELVPRAWHESEQDGLPKKTEK